MVRASGSETRKQARHQDHFKKERNLIVDVVVEGGGNDQIDKDEHGALEPRGLAVRQHEADERDRQKDGGDLEQVEVERHGLAAGCGDQRHERNHKERNLDRRADGDADGEVDLALVRDRQRGRVLGRVADDRKQNRANENRWAGARAQNKTQRS
jgi:hypothetical protein